MEAVVPLAGQLVQVLTPFLPYLVSTGEMLGTRAAQGLQDRGGDLAKKLWDRLGSKIESRPAAHEAATDLARQPGDPDAQAALRVQLRKLLLDEPILRDELQRLLADDQSSGSTTNVTASGERSVAIGRNVSGSTIITGDGQAPPRGSSE